MRVLSLAQAIRNALPDATIDFAVSNMAREVVEGHGAIDNVQVWESPKSLVKKPFAFAKYLHKIKRERYDAVLDFHAVDVRSGLVAGVSRAPRRFGFPAWRCRNMTHLFTNVKVELPRHYMNRVDEFTCLIQPIAPGSAAIRTPIALTRQHRLDAETFWRENLDLSRPAVIVHCPVYELKKRWPLPRFAELADRLLDEDRVNVVLTCGPGQGDQVQAVVANMKRTPVVAPEFLSLKDLAALIERADVFVGNDTGPMHIANALGIPIVTLFCNTYILSHRPYWDPQRVLYYAFYKQRYLPKNRGEAGAGLDRIDVETVHQACVEMLALSANKSSINSTCQEGDRTGAPLPPDGQRAYAPQQTIPQRASKQTDQEGC
jgi:heptosyltransferase-1